MIADGTMDFEYDYPRVSLDDPVEGIASRGVMRTHEDGFDFIDVLKRKTVRESLIAPGGSRGMGIAEGVTWKLRFFLSFPSTVNIGPLKFGTLTKIKKGRFSSKVEDFIWNGYGKLTTLPPGLLHDDVIATLNKDQDLRISMIDSLHKEGTITVSVYRPKAKVDYEIKHITDDSLWYKYKPKKESFAKVVITSDWKGEKDLFINKNTLEVYRRIGKTIKNMVQVLDYHLNKKEN